MHMYFSMIKLQQLSYELNILLNHEILIPLTKRNQSKRLPIKQNAQTFQVSIREVKVTLVAFSLLLLDGEISDTASYYKFFFFFFFFRRKFLKNIPPFSFRTKKGKILTVCSKRNYSFGFCQEILVSFNSNYLVLWLKSIRKAIWIA